jgi:hypothetical protein
MFFQKFLGGLFGFEGTKFVPLLFETADNVSDNPALYIYGKKRTRRRISEQRYLFVMMLHGRVVAT